MADSKTKQDLKNLEDKLDKRFDDLYETKLAALDAEIARLRAWVEAIAKKTGVSQPL